jgi:Osmosensitive K+ channel histidine kinase
MSEQDNYSNTHSEEMLAKEQSVIAGLSDEFDYVAHIDYENNKVVEYQLSYSFGKVWTQEKNTTLQFLEEFFIKSIHPEELPIYITKASKEAILESLQTSPVYNMRIRLFIDGRYQYFRLKFSKAHDSDHAFIVGLMNIDDQVRADITNAENRAKFQTATTFADTFLSSYVSVYYVNLISEKYLVFTSTDYLKKSYNHIENFSESLRAYIDKDVHPDDKSMMYELADTEYLRELLKYEKKVTLNIRDISTGDIRWYRFEVTRGSDGNHAGVAFLDITEQVLEKEREDQERIAREADQERYNFLIDIAHELRTPLTLIGGPVKRLLRKGTLANDDSRVLKRVEQQSNKMNMLLDTVFKVNELKNGTCKMNIGMVDINSWISSRVEAFHNSAAEHNMELILNCDKNAGVVAMDSDLCGIVLSNLMFNAIQRNESGESIVISSKKDDENGVIRISVKDHGIGISRAEDEDIFNRYYLSTEDNVGFSVGIVYSKSIIDSFGGKIGAFNNQDDSGSTFWFELKAS